MCERPENAEDAVDEEDAALRKIFYECDVSSLGEVPVAMLVGYIKEHISGHDSSGLLEELQKSLCAASLGGPVTWLQFRDASRRWAEKVRQLHQHQDGNNNHHNYHDDALVEDPEVERPPSTEPSDTDTPGEDDPEGRGRPDSITNGSEGKSYVGFLDLSNMSSYSTSSVPSTRRENDIGDITDLDRDYANTNDSLVGTVELRARVSKITKDNVDLREELHQAEESMSSLQKQLDDLKRKQKLTEDRCRQLERENDEQKESMDAAERIQRGCKNALQKVEKQYALLVKQLEEAESEKQRIPTLVAELEKVTIKEKELAKRLVKCKQELNSKNAECEDLQDRIVKLEDTFKDIQECYESTVHHLKNKTHDLENQLIELQLRYSAAFQLERSSLSPPVRGLHNHVHSTPCGVPKVQPQDSLCAELEASGFPFDRSRNDGRQWELEAEVEEYKTELDLYKKETEEIIELLTKAIKALAVSNLPMIQNSASCNEEEARDQKVADLECLRRQAATLVLLAAEKGPKGEPRNVSLQVCGASGFNELPEYLNIMSYHDLMHFLWEKNEHGGIVNNLEAGPPVPPQMPPYSRYDVTSSSAVPNSPFLTKERITPGSSSRNSSVSISLQEHVILAIDKILQGSTSEDSSPKEKEPAPRHNPRYSYTLPSSRLTQDTDVSTPDTPGTPSSAATYCLESPRTRCKLQPPLTLSGGDVLISDTSNPLAPNDFENKFPIELSKQRGITSTDKLRTCLIIEEANTGNKNVKISSHECDSKVQRNSSQSINLELKFGDFPIKSNEPHSELIRFVRESTEANSKQTDSEPGQSITELNLDFCESTTGRIESALSREGFNKSGVCADGRDSQLYPSEDKTKGFNDNRLNSHTEKNSNAKRHSTRVNLFGRTEVDLVERRSLDVETLQLTLESLSLRSSSPSTVGDASSNIVATSENNSFLNDKSSEKKSTRIELSSVESLQEAEHSCEKDPNSTEKPVIRVADHGTPGSSFKVTPKRKVSVFHRSFDYISLKPVEENNKEVVKRSVSFTNAPNEETEDSPSTSTPAGQDIIHESTNFSTPRFQRSFDSFSGEDSISTSSTSSCRRSRSTGESTGEESSNLNPDRPEGNMQKTEAFGFVSSNFRVNTQITTSKLTTFSMSSREKSCQGSSSTDESAVAVPIMQCELERKSANLASVDSNKSFLGLKRIDSEDQKSSSASFKLMEKHEESRNLLESQKSNANLGHNFRSRNASSPDVSERDLTATSTMKTASPDYESITSVTVVKPQTSEPAPNLSTSSTSSWPEVGKDYRTCGSVDTQGPDSHPRPPPGESNRGRQTDRETAPVVRAMSSGEDSSDSEFSPVLIETEQHVGRATFLPEDGVPPGSKKADGTEETMDESDELEERKLESERLRRSVSGSDGNDSECRCKGNLPEAADSEKEDQPMIFPSFPDDRLRELGLTTAEDAEEFGERMPEDELERKYTAISVGLGTDRLTLSMRLARSLRHRDQAERNLAAEVQKGHQDIQDGVRQRNSMSRMNLRRPSLCFETPKCESDKLDRTDSSSSSIVELRENFEPAESRRNSREENNNLIRSQSSNFIMGSCESMDSDIWSTPREHNLEPEAVNEHPRNRFSRRSSEVFRIVRANVPTVPLFWCILISFFFGFYVKHVVSTIDNTVGTPLRWWSLEELLDRHVQVIHRSPPPT